MKLVVFVKKDGFAMWFLPNELGEITLVGQQQPRDCSCGLAENELETTI